MATVANSLKVLNLYFRSKNFKKLFKVRIKDPAQNLSRETVQAAGNAIAQSKVFDFSDGFDDPYYFVKASYYSRAKTVVG